MGFEITFWDWMTFLVAAAAGASVIIILLWIAGLPGKIAIARHHPEAEAVKIMGYAGFMAIVPWIQAFIWAFKPTDVVDIRRFPPEVEKGTEEDIARLTESDKKQTKSHPKENPPPESGSTN
jgi:hypothetical protein